MPRARLRTPRSGVTEGGLGQIGRFELPMKVGHSDLSISKVTPARRSLFVPKNWPPRVLADAGGDVNMYLVFVVH